MFVQNPGKCRQQGLLSPEDCSAVLIAYLRSLFLDAMAQILQPYKVPVVYNDLSPEETIGDAFYALETLSATIDDIFGRIEKRISDERRRVDHIKSRVANCQNKVEQVRGSKKATTVFSTAKFPAPKTLPSYPTLFSQIHEVRVTRIMARTGTLCFEGIYVYR
jgi:hypothetical protein